MDLVSHLDVMRREAERILSVKTFPRFGVIQNYDPNNYRAKVMIQPENILSNWLPISSEYVGNGFGLFVAPAIGDTVLCQFVDGDFGMGVIGSGKIFLPTMPPVPCPPGQVMLVHSSGTYIKLLPSGDLDVSVAGNLNLSVTGNLAANVNGNATVTCPNVAIDASTGVTITAPTVTVNGNLAISGNLEGGTSGSGTATFNGTITTTGDVQANGISLENHYHTYNPGSGSPTNTSPAEG